MEKLYNLKEVVREFHITTPESGSREVKKVYQYMQYQVKSGKLKTLVPNKKGTSQYWITEGQVIQWMRQYRPDLILR